MWEWSATVPIDYRLSGDYEPSGSQTRSLYERAKTAQWNAATDIDWSLPVEFGLPLPDDSPFAMASFEESPFAKYGRRGMDMFRWEVQSWMVSQFLHGELGALVVAGRLAGAMPDIDSKMFAASQAVDEARHVEVFSRYLQEKIPEPYPITSSLKSLLGDVLRDGRWDVTTLGMGIMVEALALAAFRLADRTFRDDLIRQITMMVARDEARHVSFGVLSLDGLYDQMTSAERAEREDLVLSSAQLMRRRFLLEDVWDRLGVSRGDGVAYATTNPLMVAYRRAIFARIVTALGRVGLLTDRVKAGLVALDLIAGASRLDR
jgi:hypothetical protein